MLGTLSKLFSSLLSALPPTIGGSLLTISLPDVTKEAVENLLALYKQDWPEAKIKMEVVEVANMLSLPLVDTSKLRKIEKGVSKGDESGVGEINDKEGDQCEAGFEDNVEKEKAFLDPKKVKTDFLLGNAPTAKRAEKKRNTIHAVFENLEMKIQTSDVQEEVFNENEVASGDKCSGEEEELEKESLKIQAKVKRFSERWYAGVNYECNHCNFKSPSRGSLRSHLKKVHGFLPGDDLANQFASTSASLYNCKICDLSMRREYTTIANHMRLKHKTTVAGYGNKYETKREESPVATKRKNKAPSSSAKTKKLKAWKDEVKEGKTKNGKTTAKDGRSKKERTDEKVKEVKEGIEFSDSSETED